MDQFIRLWRLIVLLIIVCCVTCETNDGINCNKCSPGTFVLRQCAVNRPTLCSPCPKGTYTNVPNRLDRCKRCRTECPEKNRHHSYVLKNCTATRDLVCSCQIGYWFDDTKGRCLPYSICPQGFVVVKSGTSSSDVICGEFGKNLSTTPTPTRIGDTTTSRRLTDIIISVLISSLATVVFFLVTIVILRRRWRKHGSNAGQRMMEYSEEEKRSIMGGTNTEGYTSGRDAPVRRRSISVPSSIIDNLETFNHVHGRGNRYVRPQANSNVSEIFDAELSDSRHYSCDDYALPKTRVCKNSPCLLVPPTVCNWPKGRDFDTHECNKTYQYDNAGGELVLSGNVKLSIPPNSIQPDEVCGIKGGPVKNFQEFRDVFVDKKDEDVISSVFQFDVHEGKRFRTHVRLILKHCIQNPEAWKAIKVYHCPSADFPSQLTEVPLKSKDNNVFQPVYYVVENNQTVSVYTTHFSVYLASGNRERNMNIEASIYAKPCDSVDETPNTTRLRVYLMDVFHHVTDGAEKFKYDLEGRGYTMVDEKDLKLPKKLDAETPISFVLGQCNWRPIVEKGDDGKELLPLNQEVTVGSFAEKPTPMCAAEWMLENNEKGLKANLVITAAYVPPKPSKIRTFFTVTNDSDESEITRTEFVIRFAHHSINTAVDVSVENKVLLCEISDDDWRKLVDIAAREMRQHEQRPFGRSMGQTEGSLDNISTRYPQDKEEFVREICTSWRQAHSNGTLRAFIDKLPPSARYKTQGVVSGITTKPTDYSQAIPRQLEV